jgi:GNAT superfamily N-acetyltransferase
MECVSIRDARPDQAELIAQIQGRAAVEAYGHLFSTPYPFDEIAERWRSFGGSVRVAGSSPAAPIAGFAAVEAEELRSLYVEPTKWGCGLGSALLQDSVRIGATALWVIEVNHRARAFYERHRWMLSRERALSAAGIAMVRYRAPHSN